MTRRVWWVGMLLLAGCAGRSSRPAPGPTPPAVARQEAYGGIPTVIAGGAGKFGDCLDEWMVVNPHNVPMRTGPSYHGAPPRMNAIQTCRDGDASCDFDGAVNHACTFHVGLCFAVTDPALPACVPAQHLVTGYRFGSPRPGDGGVKGAAARVLLDALTTLGGHAEGDHQETFLLDVPTRTLRCSPLAKVVVPFTGATGGALDLRGTVLLAVGEDRGGDGIRLRCQP